MAVAIPADYESTHFMVHTDMPAKEAKDKEQKKDEPKKDEPKKPEEKKKEPEKKAEPKPPEPPPKFEPPELIPLGGDGFFLSTLLSTQGGGVQQVVLPRFKQSDRLGRAEVTRSRTG